MHCCNQHKNINTTFWGSLTLKARWKNTCHQVQFSIEVKFPPLHSNSSNWPMLQEFQKSGSALNLVEEKLRAASRMVPLDAPWRDKVYKTSPGHAWVNQLWHSQESLRRTCCISLGLTRAQPYAEGSRGNPASRVSGVSSPTSPGKASLLLSQWVH